MVEKVVRESGPRSTVRFPENRTPEPEYVAERQGALNSGTRIAPQ